VLSSRWHEDCCLRAEVEVTAIGRGKSEGQCVAGAVCNDGDRRNRHRSVAIFGICRRCLIRPHKRPAIAVWRCARRLDRVGAGVTESASHIHATITSLFLRAGDIGGARDAVYHDSV